MHWTRREFLAATSVAAVVTLPAEVAHALPPGHPPPVDDPAYLVGDPYKAAVHGPGLGGRSFEDMREQALRYRTPAVHRDRHALGLDHGHA